MFGNKLAKVEKLIEKKKVDVLAELATDKDSNVRSAAIQGLGVIGDDIAYNTLISLVRNADASIRADAALALAVMGDSSARVHLEHQLNVEKDQSVVAALHKALDKIHS